MSVAQLMEFIHGKNVAIVGNAQSIFETADGEKIDDADVVVRFNRGFIENPKAQGKRTDILFLACELTADELQQFDAQYTVNRSYKTKCGDITLDNTLRRRYRKKYDAYPSSGLMAIIMCINAGAKRIDIYGFDFGKTPTYYNPEGYVTRHEYEKEREIIKAWQDKGILTIN